MKRQLKKRNYAAVPEIIKEKTYSAIHRAFGEAAEAMTIEQEIVKESKNSLIIIRTLNLTVHLLIRYEKLCGIYPRRIREPQIKRRHWNAIEQKAKQIAAETNAPVERVHYTLIVLLDEFI